jgi:oxygen-independent coproporphyrinogen III oxidase
VSESSLQALVAGALKPAAEPAGISLYLHVPFCQVRCAYCDFNTYAGLEGLMPAYARALAAEVRQAGRACPPGAVVQTAFFGGGTPTVLPLHLYEEVFAAIHEAFVLVPDCEITLEANPGTVGPDYLRGLRGLGANRLSFGVQSSHASELRLLDRLHTFDDVMAAVRMARAAGFDGSAGGLNLDLIFGIPHQTPGMWQATVGRVLALEPEHVSMYALSLEHGTPMRSWVYRGLLPMPDPELAAGMYTWAAEALADWGYRQYEISNWALHAGRQPAAGAFGGAAEGFPRHACRHNLQYWRNGAWLGFGAGAHGSIPGTWPGWLDDQAVGVRYSNALAPAAYIRRMQAAPAKRGAERGFPPTPAAVQITPISRLDERNDTMLLGLRLTGAGVRAAEFERRFGVPLEAAYRRSLRRLSDLGLIEWNAQGARLTSAGRLLGNRVFREFV